MTAAPQAPTLFRDRLMEALCTKCGAKMTLARIEPDKPGYDLRSFECTKCNNVDQYIVEYETSSPWVLVVRGSSTASGGRPNGRAHRAGIILALQLSFCFEVRTLSDRLVSSAP